MKKNLCAKMILLVFSVFLGLSGLTLAYRGMEAENTMGCMPDGNAFDNIVPNSVNIREVAYITLFGTMNTNIVVGNQVPGSVAAGLGELSERLGEFLFSINTTALVNNIVFMDKDIPAKYLEERTLILCGGPEENQIVKQLVIQGKSKVDWKKAQHGAIEVIPNAFGGPGTAIIAAGSNGKGTSLALGGLSAMFVHFAGANMTEEGLLRTDDLLRNGDVKDAVKSVEHLIAGIRLDSSSKVAIPVKDIDDKFHPLLKQEIEQAKTLLKLLRKNPTIEQADVEFRKLAGFCAYCHQRYLSYDRMGQNRISFHYSQYGDTRCESKWALTGYTRQLKVLKEK